MNEFVTETLLGLSAFSRGLNNFSWAKPDLNTLFLLFFLVVFFLIVFGLGKTRILVAVVSTYIALFLESVFPYSLEVQNYLGDYLGGSAGLTAGGSTGLTTGWSAVFWEKTLMFFIFFIVALLILNRSILKPKMSLRESSPLAVLFLSLLEAGLLASAFFSYWFVGNPNAGQLSIFQYFGTKNAQFFWAVVPMLSLLFFKNRKKTPVI